MNKKIIDALTIIAEGLQQSKSVDEIYHYLNNETKFDSGTVNVAFSIFFERLKKNKKEHLNTTSGIRFLSEEEEMIIGKENYNYLLKLLNLSIITPYEFELILDRVFEFPDEIIDGEDISWMVLFALTELDNELLPGSRFTLFSSDKIN
jgi:uncharacterized protein Smg (DUF494 family)